ncbi:MAG: dihydropteroate synthase [Verrucomicrobiota bacterium]|jgi:dihydropteroate synthase
MIWKFRDREFDLTKRGLIVGILNTTPDSFSDGGLFLNPNEAVKHGLKLIADGADILDIGGESTRPGSESVGEEEEMSRVLPVIKALRAVTDVPFSIDTSKASVADAALEAGADIINDVTALCGDARMGEVAASRGAGLILMHMQGRPQTMQLNPSYAEDDVVRTVAKFLSERRAAAIGFGVDAAAITLDPGLGFGKTMAHNLALLRGIPELVTLGSPLMIGHSRKSFLGKIKGLGAVQDRGLAAAVALTGLAYASGARLFRVHEAAPHREALRVTEAVFSS